MHNPNPYTPTATGDTELFRLSSRSSKLWKYTVIAFETASSVVLQITIVFWAFFYYKIAWADYTNLEQIRLYVDYIVPIVMFATDFVLNAIVFSPTHCIFPIAAIVIYDCINVGVSMVDRQSIYKEFSWEDLNIGW